MRIEGQSPDGKTFWGEAENLYQSTIEWLQSFNLSEQNILKVIDNLDISADWKQRLHKVTRITIKAGTTVLWIGCKILEQVLLLLRTFPNTGFGLIFAALVGTLVSSIPIIGWVLGPVVTPILMLLWGGQGLLQDIKNIIKDKLLSGKVEDISVNFNPLRTPLQTA